MMEKLKKLQIKGYVAGFLSCLLLFGTVGFVHAQTVTRQVTYGVRVSLNGQIMQFADDSRPFVIDNRTFLPVRAIADAVGLPVDFDRTTNTVYLGDRLTGQRRPLNDVAPFFDRSTHLWNVSNERSIVMGGTTFQNAIRYHLGRGWSVAQSSAGFTLHNLDGQYRIFSGYFGRIDGSDMVNATINIIGDNVSLHSFELIAGNLPQEFSVFVEGVRLLRVEVIIHNSGTRTFGLVGFLE